MSKEAWFRHFERVKAEHPELPDELAAEVALDWLREEMADKADMEWLRRKEGGDV